MISAEDQDQRGIKMWNPVSDLSVGRVRKLIMIRTSEMCTDATIPQRWYTPALPYCLSNISTFLKEDEPRSRKSVSADDSRPCANTSCTDPETWKSGDIREVSYTACLVESAAGLPGRTLHVGCGFGF